MNAPYEVDPSLPVLDEDLVRECLRGVDDPELGCNIIDLGLIYGIRIDGPQVHVQMTLTTAGCPMHESMVHGVKFALMKLEQVQNVEVELVWDPPWSPAMMTPEGRELLGVAE